MFLFYYKSYVASVIIYYLSLLHSLSDLVFIITKHPKFSFL